MTTGSIAMVKDLLVTLNLLSSMVIPPLSSMLNLLQANLDPISVALLLRELTWKIPDLLVLLDLTSKEDNSLTKL